MTLLKIETFKKKEKEKSLSLLIETFPLKEFNELIEENSFKDETLKRKMIELKDEIDKRKKITTLIIKLITVKLWN